MLNRNTRWAWLTVFAVANLVCWVGVGVAAGLVVGDSVDLGVETLIRRGQATVVAVWKQAPTKAAPPTALPTAIVQTPSPTQVHTVPSKPQATITWAVPATTFATAEPETTLVSSPLLLADPEITSLTRLDAEMDRSAPGRAVQIRYQENTLNHQIAALWENNPELTFRDAHIDLQRDHIVVTGKTTVLGFEVRGEVTGNVVAKECVPELEIESVSIAGVMTPVFVKDEIVDLILQAVAWYPADYPICLEQIVLEDTRLTVYGYRR
ncbi:MAG TPA: hypothetical protein VLY63_24750 [Anaerolineae bacterium]|nr:hypothetical protein [Anaerolineae bacterium]